MYQKEYKTTLDSSTVIQLPDSLLIPEKEVVQVDSLPWQLHRDYEIDYLTGKITLKSKFSKGSQLTITYQIFPFALQTTYFKRKLKVAEKISPQTDGSPATEVEERGVPINASPAPRFASQLRKNGSLTRGITVGTNQGLRVDSGLRLQLSGKLTEDVEIIASLTDQNTPIQPEGNTQTLQEIDKVFVELRGPHMQATLGDYNLSFTGTEFTRYRRKLQGVKGRAEFQNWEFTVSGAVSRGKFTTNEFLGQEGNQGPYQLHGENGEIDIIVLAGTERVWVDGQLMTRGENNDYVIEYGNGQITFTRHRLITADSRIVVDFQYSDEKFQRNLWGIQGQTRLLNDRVKLRTTYIRESDNKDNPLGFELTDEQLKALEEAGDSLAVLPGWKFVGLDSGNYIRDSTGVFIYVGPRSGDYQVSFGFFGANKGDYRKVGIGHFEFVGEDQGSYRPYIILPRAQSHEVVGFNAEFSPNNMLKLQTEVAMSQFDANLYSPRDNQDNQGLAYVFKLNFAPEALKLGNAHLGHFRFEGKFRRKNANFRDIDRTTVAEFNRRWDITRNITTREETIGEFQANYSPVSGLNFQGGFGRLNKAALLKSNRWDFQTTLQKKHFPHLHYFVEFIDRNLLKTNQKSNWLRQRGHFDYQFKFLQPIFEYEGEIKKEARTDTSQTGFRYDSYTAKLQLSPGRVLQVSASYNYRNDKLRQAGLFLPKSVARTQSYFLKIYNWHNIRAKASYIHRMRDFADPEQPNSRTDLADLQLGYRPRHGGVQARMNYQISNTQIARQEEVFEKVKEGEGNYRFDEQFQEFVPDPFGDFIRRVFKTNDFIPVVELRFRTLLRLQPGRFFLKSKIKGWLAKILNPISTETFLRINEKTRERDVSKIYLLNLSHFQQDSTTIFGSMELRQDIHLWENRRKFSLRFRFIHRKEKNNQFIDGGQDRRVREQSLRLIAQLSRHLSTQVEVRHQEEDRLFKSILREDRQVRANSLIWDLVYRPRRRLELGLKSEFSFNQDLVPDPVTRANLVAFAPRATYSLSRKGRFRGQIEWTRVTVAPLNRLIPFEVANGNKPGVTLRWNLALEYRIARNMQASLSYFGQSEPDRPRIQHIAKMEMRAFF